MANGLVKLDILLCHYMYVNVIIVITRYEQVQCICVAKNFQKYLKFDCI